MAVKKEIWLLGVLGLIMVILLGILFLVPAKPAKAPQTTQNNPAPVVDGLQIINPKANEEVSFPIKIIGAVSGNGWSGFEGTVGYVDLIKDNQIIGTATLNATTEWTSLPITFETEISSTVKCGGSSKCKLSGDASLVFHNENSSGMPEKEKTFTLPIKLK